MAKSIPLEDLAGRLSEISRSHLIAALHQQALKYSALAEKKAKHKASAVLTPRTGHLVQSITGRAKKGKGEIVIALSAGGGRNDVKYAKVHEQDGKRGSYFIIKPKNGPFLVWPVSGNAFTDVGVAKGEKGDDVELAFARQVRIPSRPFLRPTVDLIRKKMLKDIAKILGEEILK